MAHYWRAALAQLVEQLSCKQQVIGSSPIGGSTEKRPRADESRRGAFCCARRYWRVGAFGPRPSMCSPSAVQGWCVGSCVVAGAEALAYPGVCVVAGAGGGLSGGLCCVRGIGVCGGKRCRVAGVPWYVAGGCRVCGAFCCVQGALACVEESVVGLLGRRGTSWVGTMVFWALARNELGITAGRGQRSTPDYDLDVVWGPLCRLRSCGGSSPTQEQRNGATEEQRSCGTRATAHILLTGERLLP